jgi:hypothetical protein
MRPIHTKRRQRLNCSFGAYWRPSWIVFAPFLLFVLAAIMESFLTLPFVPVAAIMDRFHTLTPTFEFVI